MVKRRIGKICFLYINRETTEETILGLLEDTCNKINAAQLAWLKLKKKIRLSIR